MALKLPIWDQRMLLLMKHCIDTEVCDNKADFLISIGMQPTNLNKLKAGERSFTVDQIAAAASKYKINVNWIFGLESEMKLKKPVSTITLLKDAVRSLEAEYKHGK